VTDTSQESPELPVVNGNEDTSLASALEREAAARVRPRSDAVERAAAGRLTYQLDHRLRSLELEGHVPADPERANLRQRHRLRPLATATAVFLGVAACAILLLQLFVIQVYSVPGDAMTPTLQSGDRILVLKAPLLRGSIHKGDIVVFRSSGATGCDISGDGARNLVRRVVALPGETIQSVGDRIVVDGRPLREAGWYDRRFGQIGSVPISRTTLRANRYFVLADNRANGCDSRTLGAIASSAIVGRGIAVVGQHGRAILAGL
jgi:signal peptidase I